MTEQRNHGPQTPPAAPDYRDTVNLPRTVFPMRANLPRREMAILRKWEQIDLYARAQERTRDGASFILHDEPPFSDGDIQLDHALNKILKDVIIKFRSMRGEHAPFVPGWDTSGLPTEITAVRAFHHERAAIAAPALRRRCAELARKNVALQRAQFIRLGVRGDWEHPYLTMSPAYAATVLDVFARLVEAGLIYRGHKPVHWCLTCASALSATEIAYAEQEAPALYVAFPLLRLPDAVFAGQPREKMSAVIWSSSAWTLPGSAAVAVHPAVSYALLTDAAEREHFTYLVARERVDAFAQATHMRRPTVLDATHGGALEGAVCQHPFLERRVPIVLADDLTLESGTGLVSCAPDHDEDAFATGRRYGLPLLQAVGPRGIYGPAAGPFAGQAFDDVQKALLARMNRDGTLLAYETLPRQLPYCWRCREAVIMRAIPQWFLAVAQLQAPLRQAIDAVRWRPAGSRKEMAHLVNDRPDWCLSRQRVWGIPIPVLYCAACQAPLLSPAVIARARDIVRLAGAEAWYQRPLGDFLPEHTVCAQCGHDEFVQDTEIFDVWFASGSSHLAVLEPSRGLCWPADLALERQDQYRGWLQASLLTGVGVGRSAPYREVLSHGFVRDQTGRTPAKAPDHLRDPQQVVRSYGADLLRLWVAATDYRANPVMSAAAFAQVVAGYRRLRNTFRFCLGNLYDFTPERAVPTADLREIDRWALHRLGLLVTRVTEAYARYAFHQAYRAINAFVVTDLSAFYLDVAKEWLYPSLPDAPARRSTQTAFHAIAQVLAQLLTPVLSFTAEEVWEQLPLRAKAASIQLTDWPTVREAWHNPALDARWAQFLIMRDVVHAALARARARSLISQPFAAKVTLFSAGESTHLLESLDTLPQYFRVSAVSLAPWDERPATACSGAAPHLAVMVAPAAGAPCPRCRRWRTTLGQHARYPTLCAACAQTVGALEALQAQQMRG